MKYNLNDRQKNLLRKLVNGIRNKEWGDTFLDVSAGGLYVLLSLSNNANITIESISDMDVLANTELVFKDFTSKSTKRYTITQAAHDAIDNNFMIPNEQDNKQPPSISYTFQNSSNIIAGNQGIATLTLNIEKIESEIELNGGKDKEELYAFVKEIKDLFEKQSTLPKSALARFSETLEKHSWLTGSLVQLLGTAAINYLLK